jgi:hypothetical protein
LYISQVKNPTGNLLFILILECLENSHSNSNNKINDGIYTDRNDENNNGQTSNSTVDALLFNRKRETAAEGLARECSRAFTRILREFVNYLLIL